jgi:hypothetical protein
MGAQRVAEMIAYVGVEAALEDHFSHGCYPPIPAIMLPVAKTAIRCADAGDWDLQIVLPDGVQWRRQTSCSVAAVIDGLRLGAFLHTINQNGSN